MSKGLYGRELRFECLRLANSLALSKVLGHTKVIEKAQEFVAYVEDDKDVDFAEVEDDQ